VPEIDILHAGRIEPACAIVSVGQDLLLSNLTRDAHTFTVEGTDVDVRVPGLTDVTTKLTGVEPGTYRFQCRLHDDVKGTVEIRA
jgi:plastocyanin